MMGFFQSHYVKCREATYFRILVLWWHGAQFDFGIFDVKVVNVANETWFGVLVCFYEEY